MASQKVYKKNPCRTSGNRHAFLGEEKATTPKASRQVWKISPPAEHHLNMETAYIRNLKLDELSVI